MRNRLQLSAGAMIVLAGASIAQAEPPTFELNGFPITRHQLIAVQTDRIRERSPAATRTVAGMPASPHQVGVLTPRPLLTVQEIAEKLMEDGVTGVRFVGPAAYTVIGLQNGGWITLSIDSRTGHVVTGASGH